MTTRRAMGIAMLLALGARGADAHRLDEYLQATTIAIARSGVRLQLRLTPGVAVFSRVLGDIDANGDGALSRTEERTYADRVLRDLSLAVDGERRPLRLAAATFPDVAAMREGRGEIVLDVDAEVPDAGGDRRLTFENRHERVIGVYLVNALVPQDAAVSITGQRRTFDQSSYTLDYAQRSTRTASLGLASVSRAVPWIGMALLLPLGWIVLLRQRRAKSPGAGGAGLGLGILVALATPVARASAHPMPQSAVLLDFRAHTVGAELRLPVDRLEIGFGRPLAGDAQTRAITAAATAFLNSLTAEQRAKVQFAFTRPKTAPSRAFRMATGSSSKGSGTARRCGRTIRSATCRALA